jgi:quinol monooxygenase YgiN
MYVVIVDFKIRPERVCVDPKDRTSVFLYELYDDRAAFDAHLATAHFKKFDPAVAPMLAAKAVRTLERVLP